MSTQNTLARTFKALHVPGNPILLTNVYDVPSANAVAFLPLVKAMATASYAVAAAAGLADDEMSMETNLAAVRGISRVAAKHNIPFTVDWQDGYGSRLEEGIAALLDAGVVGINLEDYDKEAQRMYSIAEATDRINRVLVTAKAKGVPDFVVNARTDILLYGGLVSEAISRGKAYLDAGATTVFVWGGPSRGGITRAEVEELVEGLGGRLNVSMKVSSAGLTAKELRQIGVARISIGPALQFLAMAAFAAEAGKILGSAQ